MNFHPLLVHFPIAFLVGYTFLEFLSIFPKVKNQPYIFYVKAILLFFGILGAGAAILSGLLIENDFSASKQLVNLHSHINEIGIGIYSLLGLAYLLGWLEKVGRPITILKKFDQVMRESILVYGIAGVGFTCILIGSALGGIIAYGVGLDPFTRLIYSLIVKIGLLH